MPTSGLQRIAIETLIREILDEALGESSPFMFPILYVYANRSRINAVAEIKQTHSSGRRDSGRTFKDVIALNLLFIPHKKSRKSNHPFLGFGKNFPFSQFTLYNFCSIFRQLSTTLKSTFII